MVSAPRLHTVLNDSSVARVCSKLLETFRISVLERSQLEGVSVAPRIPHMLTLTS